MRISQLILTLSLFLAPLMAKTSFEPVTLQLHWKHQFEYAGFYAAIEKGFYKEAGLEVRLKEYEPGIDILRDVTKGKSEYGLLYSSLIASYMKGEPVVMLANFFKHSALILVTQPGIVNPSDLRGKKVMGVKDEILSSPIALMLDKFGVKIDDITLVPPTFRLEEFARGEVDAMTAFITNETYRLDQKKIRYNILNPASYSSQFYDVNLFTSEEEIKNHPERVEAFTRASIRGWAYALANSEEIIDLILAKYNTQQKSRDALRFEAEMVKKLILPELYPLGSIEKKIIADMTENYKKIGILPADAKRDFGPFIYDLHHPATTDGPLWSEKEHRYLETKKQITMCVDPDWMPYEKLEEGRHIGIVADYYRKLEHKLGVPVTIVPTVSWTQSLAYAKARRCDLLSLLMQTPERSEFVNVTPNVFDMPSVLATRNDQFFVNTIDDILDKPIGVVKGYADAEMLRLKHPGINLVEVDDLMTGLKMVRSGKLFGQIDTLPTLAYAIQREFTGELKISGKFDERQEHGIGVRNDDPMLFEIIKKAAASIDEKERQEMLNRWISITYEQPFDYMLLWKIAAAIGLLALIVLYRQMILARYNKALKAEVASQVDELRRKDDIMLRNYQMAMMGEMVGVIAHQIKQPLSSIGLTVQDIEEAYNHGEIDRNYIRNFIDTSLDQIEFMADTIDDLRNFFNPNKVRKRFDTAQAIRKSLQLLSKQYYKYNIATMIDADPVFIYGVESELQQIILNITNNAKEALLENKIESPRIAIRSHLHPESGDLLIEIEDNAGGIPEPLRERIFDAYFTTKGENGTGVGLYMVRKIVRECFSGTITVDNTAEGACFKIRIPNTPS